MTTEADIDDPSGEAPPSAERRGPAGPRTVPEADTFRFDGVDQPGGPDDRPDRRNMTLVFDERGIETSGRETRHHAFVPWSQVVGVTFGAEVDGPDGGVETPIEVESTGGPAHYVVRSDHPLAVMVPALEEQVSRWAAATPDEPDPTASSGLVTAWAPPPPRHPPPVAQPAAQPAGPGAPSPWPPPAAVDPALAGFLLAPPGLESPTGHPRPVPYSVGPYGPDGAPADPAHRKRTHRKRTHRTATLVVALCLLVSGIGLAVGLSLSSATGGQEVATAPAPPTDLRLARELMLTKADLPAGWRVATGAGAGPTSPAVQQGQDRITLALARCMGITKDQAATVLGGRAPDQTAQAASPIFIAPTASVSDGSAVELQTAATVVRSHRDELADFALFRSAKYPQCVATASAAELQLGVDQTSGGIEQPGPVTVSPVTLPGSTGVELSALLMVFTVKAGEASVPVQVESISLGSDRVEAGLQVFAIGGTIPDVSASFSTFEQRVASGGKSSEV